MADLEDVMDALADVAAGALYPSGSSSPSVTGDVITIRPGWPDASVLEEDLNNGVVWVSIFATDTERNVTRFPRSDSEVVSNPAPTLVATVTSPQSFTLSGSIAIQHNVGILINGISTGFVLALGFGPGTTLANAATGLAALLTTGGFPATATGPTVTVPSGVSLGVNVGTTGSVIRELRRQVRLFQIITWARTVEQRRAITPILDAAYAKLTFLTLADGTAGRIIYRGSPILDKFEKANLFRRDLHYEVEYGTTATEGAVQIVAPILDVNGG